MRLALAGILISRIMKMRKKRGGKAKILPKNSLWQSLNNPEGRRSPAKQPTGVNPEINKDIQEKKARYRNWSFSATLEKASWKAASDPHRRPFST